MVAPGNSKATTPKITPSRPRSAISHQLSRSALFRTFDVPDDGLNRYGLSVAVCVLMTRLLPCSRNGPRECRRIRCRAAAVWHPPFSPPQSLVWRPARRVDVRQFHRVIPPKYAARPTSQPPACAVTYFYATQICEIHSASNIVSIYPPRAARPLRRKVVEERSDALPRSIGGRRHCVRRSRLRRRCVLQFGLDVLGRRLRAGRYDLRPQMVQPGGHARAQ